MLDIIKNLAWPITIIVCAIVVLGLARGGRVRGLSASKDGGLKVDFSPLETRGTIEYNLNRRIQEIDEQTRAAAREEVRRLRKPLTRALGSICYASERAMAGELRGIMYGAVDENNLKEHLAAGPTRTAYIEAKLGTMAEEYGDLLAGQADCRAPDPTPPPPWSEVESAIREILEGWAGRVAAIVASASRDKIAAYREYRPQFDTAGDQSYVAIVDGCIAKNEAYAAALEG